MKPTALRCESGAKSLVELAAISLLVPWLICALLLGIMIHRGFDRSSHERLERRKTRNGDLLSKLPNIET
jgi:hypothetical protein